MDKKAYEISVANFCLKSDIQNQKEWNEIWK